ncbi:hypothetical protein [Vibrio sp. D431a]|uniref:hypothetical protein n=1 Tax=Vibrio sp. D431a TaxID=2837388 RepID=UPI002554A36E|nr:hypothetical protein [Vibrio sp. D431a]MDK9793781.1 hypothetical protein [Vibrio sp. D431a]
MSLDDSTTEEKIFHIDSRLEKVFDNLTSKDLKVGEIIKGLNFVLSDSEEPYETIETKDDFINFLEQMEDYKNS